MDVRPYHRAFLPNTAPPFIDRAVYTQIRVPARFVIFSPDPDGMPYAATRRATLPIHRASIPPMATSEQAGVKEVQKITYRGGLATCLT